MAALSTIHRKMMTFGTHIVVVLNSNFTNFGVSRTDSIVLPQFTSSDYSPHAYHFQYTLRLSPIQYGHFEQYGISFFF